MVRNGIGVSIVGVLVVWILHAAHQRYVVQTARERVLGLNQEARGVALVQFELELVKIDFTIGVRAVDLAPRLVGPLRLQGHIGKLHVGLVDVARVVERVVRLRSDVGTSKRPVVAQLVLKRQVPLLHDRIEQIAVRHIHQRIGGWAALTGRWKRI